MLYSDIGDFYSGCGAAGGERGWVIRNCEGTIWDVGKVSLDGPVRGGEWEELDILGVEKLLKEDTQWIKEDVIESTISTGRTSFTFLPGEGVTTSQIHRVLVSPPVPQISIWGTHLKSDRRTFATWSIDKGPSTSLTLIITRLRATQTTFPHLIGKLMDVARDHGLEYIEVWNLPKEFVEVAGRLGGKTDERDEHLPAFKWYGVEGEGEVDFLFNEK